MFTRYFLKAGGLVTLSLAIAATLAVLLGVPTLLVVAPLAKGLYSYVVYAVALGLVLWGVWLRLYDAERRCRREKAANPLLPTARIVTHRFRCLPKARLK